MNVAVSWWPPQHAPGGRSQAIAGNVRGFRQAGCNVDVWWSHDLQEASQDDLEPYDLLLVPYISTGFDAPCHVHLQIGGYGDPNIDREGLQAALEHCDTWSVLDPRLAYYFLEYAGIDISDARVIPNAPNKHLFEPQPFGPSKGHVLVPKVGGPYKSADILNQIAGTTGEITYKVFSGVDPPDLNRGNVVYRPAVPLSDMERYYRQAELIFNPAIREGLPNVAFESFLTERPYVTTPRGIGLIQTLPKDVLDSTTFGLPVPEFVEEYHSDFYDGDHYHTTNKDHLYLAIRSLIEDDELRYKQAKRGRRWVESLDYTWKHKAELILMVAGLR